MIQSKVSGLQNVPVILAILLAMALFLVMALPLSAVDWTDSVRTHSGLVSGEGLEDGIRVFRGIPFAAPPVGDLRWRPPQEVAPWDEMRNATEFGAVCPQPPTLAAMGGGTLPEFSEDCLFLNLWTPAQDPDEALPVMVWIHGGGLSLGYSNQEIYDGVGFAKHGIVLVSINYRLGPLGFLAHPELSAESADGASGNYGFLDQLAALEWVQKNIAAFGGDPDTVTIFGESAGGTSVFALLTSPMSEGLFHRAIAESPWVTETNVTYQSKATPFVASGEAQGVEFARLLVGEDADASLPALRAFDADEMIKKGGFSPFINVDRWFMPEAPETTFAAGRQRNVPLIVGTNANEGTMFMAAFIQSVESYEKALDETYGDQSKAVLAMYPAALKEDLAKAADRFITDAWFLRPGRAMLRATSKVSSPGYQYHFTRASRAIPAWGAHHAAELGYVFNTYAGFGPQVDPNAEDLDLGATMIDYWSQFAKTGDPNGNGRPHWPVHQPGSEAYLELGDTIRSGTKLRKAACDALDGIIAKAHAAL